jgi:hypothetical protein
MTSKGTTTMNQEHWKNEVAQRRAKLEHIRSELRVARQRYLESAAEIDASNVMQLADRERLADEALTYAEEQLRAATTVRITRSREQLVSHRTMITRAMDRRHQEREQQIARERQRCGRMLEKHVETHLRNVFGRYDFNECAGDAEDKRTLASIDAELAEHDRLDAEAPGAA